MSKLNDLKHAIIDGAELQILFKAKRTITVQDVYSIHNEFTSSTDKDEWMPLGEKAISTILNNTELYLEETVGLNIREIRINPLCDYAIGEVYKQSLYKYSNLYRQWLITDNEYVLKYEQHGYPKEVHIRKSSTINDPFKHWLMLLRTVNRLNAKYTITKTELIKHFMWIRQISRIYETSSSGTLQCNYIWLPEGQNAPDETWFKLENKYKNISTI